MTVAAPHSDFRFLSSCLTKLSFSSSELNLHKVSGRPTDSECLTSDKAQLHHSALLQNSECNLDFYKIHFWNQTHFNYVTTTSTQGPIVVSMRIGQDGDIRILIRTTRGSERIVRPVSSIVIPWFRKVFGISYLSILNQICPAIPIRSLVICQHPRLPEELVRMEERQIIRCYKFGVYHLLPGQTTEQQALANPCDSSTPAFSDFLHWLGESVRLCGWEGYRAGLDVVGDTTGKTSIFTLWQGYQIMFHCAPLLPFDPRDHQQVERRRFIGNDIVVIVFKECDDDDEFDLGSVGSRQNHIICVVRPIRSKSGSQVESYRVAIAVKNGIRDFVPLTFPAVLQRDDASRDLLLLKLICGERAAYGAKAFATQLLRTRESLLRDAIEACR